MPTQTDGLGHLMRYGYAPGSYMSKCHRCGEIVEGVDKRATCCLPCAKAGYEFEQRAAPAARKTRAEFERFFAESRKSKGAGKRPTFARLPDDTYADDHTQRHWWTWQQGASAERSRIASLLRARGLEELARMVEGWE